MLGCEHGAAFNRVLSSVWLWFAILLFFAVIDQIHLGRTLNEPSPMTTSLALQDPAHLLLHGKEPYAVHLFDGSPVSPGPGWIILLMPLTAIPWTGMIDMVGLALTAAVIRRRTPVGAGVFIILMLVQPMFQSQSANGQDLYLISLALVFLSLLMEEFASHRGKIVLLGVLAGAIATSRMPMAGIICIPALGLIRKARSNGWLFLAVTLIVCFCLNFTFAAWAHSSGDVFQPMHVFHRASANAGIYSKIATAILPLAAMFWIFRYMKGTATSWLFGTWLFMSALFVPEGFKELVVRHFDLTWEGANYITFPLPLMVALVALAVCASADQSAGSRTSSQTASVSC